MDGEHQDTRDIVKRTGSLLFGEVSHEVIAILIALCHDIEQEWLHIVVQGLGAKEQLRKKTEVLTVDGVLATINFEE